MNKLGMNKVGTKTPRTPPTLLLYCTHISVLRTQGVESSNDKISPLVAKTLAKCSANRSVPSQSQQTRCTYSASCCATATTMASRELPRPISVHAPNSSCALVLLSTFSASLVLTTIQARLAGSPPHNTLVRKHTPRGTIPAVALLPPSCQGAFIKHPFQPRAGKNFINRRKIRCSPPRRQGSSFAAIWRDFDTTQDRPLLLTSSRRPCRTDQVLSPGPKCRQFYRGCCFGFVVSSPAFVASSLAPGTLQGGAPRQNCLSQKTTLQPALSSCRGGVCSSSRPGQTPGEDREKEEVRTWYCCNSLELYVCCRKAEIRLGDKNTRHLGN